VTILHSLTASTRRPLRSVEFNIAAAQRGLVPLDARLLCIGTKLAAGTATAETPTEVFDEADADAKFGKSSAVALMLRFAMKAARAYGKSPRFFGAGVAEPGAGVANAQTITITGPATASGNLHLRIAGRDIVVGIANSAVQNDIAADLEGVIDEKVAELPGTAGVATNVVTFTHAAKGENGGDVLIEVVSKPAGVGVTIATSAAGSGVIDITASLDAAEGQDFKFIAIENHKSADITDLATHLASMWAATTKRFRFAFVGGRASLATQQALASAADDFKVVQITAENFPLLPGEMAAGIAAIRAGEDDPALHINELELGWCPLPLSDADLPTDAEIESAIAGGMTILTANAARTKAMTSRVVTTKVTHASVPFYALLDVTIPLSMVYAAQQVDIAQALATAQQRNKKKTQGTKDRVRSVTYAKLKQIEELEIIQNVDAHAGELTVEDDPVVVERIVTAIPTSVVPILNQIANVINLIQE